MSVNKRRACFWKPQRGQNLKKDQSITHKPLFSLTYLAVSCRLFYLLIIDLPETHNAAWLAALFGALFASPAIICAYLLMRAHGAELYGCTRKTAGDLWARAFCALCALALAYDASAMFVALTGSAAYATLYNTPPILLMVPTALAITISASRGGNASGGCAITWLRILPFLYILVLIWQYESTNFTWLTPILGPGVNVLMRAGQLCAAYFCMIPVAFLASEGVNVYGPNDTRPAKPSSILRLFLYCALTVVILCAIHTAMYPNIPQITDSRSIQLDLLMSNGKSNRAIQLPMLLIWFGTLALTALFMVYCAGRLASRAFKRDDAVFTYALGALALIAAICGFAKQNNALLFAQYAVFPLGGFFVLASARLIKRKEKGK